MASPSSFTSSFTSPSTCQSFTISQARIGEPLLFQPALGSKELEALVDAYVVGSASKQDKLSQVTLEFFNLAQVDIYTGLLTRHYSVALPISPAQSQSSGLTPPFYTPSPASSATFADSGYGSFSMTPPTRTHTAHRRVTKRAMKDTKKAAEARLPGFSIMTKDGVDVTSSAGRGTKTKEQREHAHLMRIMKACDECKRKKVRCDPSHRGQQTEMSRSSLSTASTEHPKPRSSKSKPSSSQPSPPELPSFGNSAIDDFVLFPEEDALSWNPADMSFPEYDENLDLSQFDFDLDNFNDFLPISNTRPEQYFDLSSFDQQPATSFQLDQPFRHDPLIGDPFAFDQYALAQGDGLSPSHTRPHHSLSSQNSGQLDSNFFDGFEFTVTESRASQPTSSSQVTAPQGTDLINESVVHNESELAPPNPLQQSPQATGVMLPPAPPLLARGARASAARARALPNPSPVQTPVMTVATIAAALAACQCLLLSAWVTRLNSLVNTALIILPLMKNPLRSLDGFLTSSKSRPTTFTTCKDTSMLAMFGDLGLSHRLAVA